MIQAPGQVLDAAGDVLASGEPEQAHDDVAGGGQELGRCAGSDLGPVLVERPVADVVLAVFHFPVAAVAGQDVGGVGLPGGPAGDPVHGLWLAQRVPVQVVDLAVDAEGLVDAGEVQAGDIG